MATVCPLHLVDTASFMGGGGREGTRAVASHDEDTTTLGVEAAWLALRSAPGKTNAAAVAASFRLPGDVGPYGFGGAVRSGVDCLIAAFRASGVNRSSPGI
jgi:hydroxymethylglutaryl-CoA synthase